MGLLKETKSFVPPDLAQKAKEEETAYLASLGKTLPAQMTIKGKPAIPNIAKDGPGQDVISRSWERITSIFTQRTEKLKKRYNELLQRMSELRESQYLVESSPITKDELLTTAKKAFAEERKKWKETLLAKHLGECQNRKATPFSELSLKMLFYDEEYSPLFLGLIDEADIERAVKNLPGIGMSEKDRKAKVQEIEKEIADIEALIEQEAKEIEAAESQNAASS